MGKEAEQPFKGAQGGARTPPALGSDVEMEDRSRSHVLPSRFDVKLGLLDVDVTRPSHCVECGQAAHVGGRKWLHGNGVVERQLRGPETVDGPPKLVVIEVREYECQVCLAVMRVVPRGVIERKHFSGVAIALAFAVVGLLGGTAVDARRRVNEAVAGHGARGWSTVGRWASDVASGRLFTQLDLRDLPKATVDVASRAALALCGRAPPWARGSSLDHQAFAGAAM